jgi:hypothetical protein
MVEKAQDQRTVWYEIRTTAELDEVVFFADKVTVHGSFVEFRPYKSASKHGSVEMKNVASLIFPERVIVEIIFRKIESNLGK